MSDITVNVSMVRVILIYPCSWKHSEFSARRKISQQRSEKHLRANRDQPIAVSVISQKPRRLGGLSSSQHLYYLYCFFCTYNALYMHGFEQNIQFFLWLEPRIIHRWLTSHTLKPISAPLSGSRFYTVPFLHYR